MTNPGEPAPTDPEASSPRSAGTLGEVARYFLRLGFTAFGGPAAHVGLMRRDLVRQRAWVTDQEFADMLGVANLIPGPNSTEMAMHLGGHRAGWRGVWIAGAAFIGPAVAIVLALAWAYVEWGTTPNAEGLLSGVQPVVLAILLQAIWGLRKVTVTSPITLAVVAVAVVLEELGISEVFILLGLGSGTLAAHALTRGVATRSWPRAVREGAERIRRRVTFLVLVPAPISANLSTLLSFAAVRAGDTPEPTNYAAGTLFLIFLKIGAVLYGSGYVLISFLQSDLVDSRHWLTQQQLLDAVAVGQFTPGPLFSTATFIGYVLGGYTGAGLATAGIFLPSFAFVSVTHPLLPRMRSWRWMRPFLDGVNAAAVALMAVVTLELARHAIDTAFTLVLFALSAAWLLRWKPNSAFVVLAGAGAGLIHSRL